MSEGTMYTSTTQEEAVSVPAHSFWTIQEELPTIKPAVFGDIGPFAIANTTTTMVLIAFCALLVVSLLGKHKEKPGAFQNAIEFLYEGMVSLVVSIVGDRERAHKVAPYITVIVVYLAFANLLPLLPGVLAVTAHIPGEGGAVQFFRGVTTDFNTTFSLALAAVIILQFVGIREQGPLNYLSHFIQIKQVIAGFRKGLGAGMLAIVGFLVGVIEIVGEIAKTVSLSLRLFGNMFAHEVLTGILLSVFAFGLPAIWMGMGVLVGVVQSLVFAALITVYYSLVLKKDSH